MPIQTAGFRTSIFPQFTPVDPGSVVRDPNAFLRGLATTTTTLNDLAQIPRQNRLKDIELAQQEEALANAPARKKLLDLQLEEAVRQGRLADLQPLEYAQKPTLEFDENGNLVQYQTVYGYDPQTGQPTDAYSPAGTIVKTAAQIEAPLRAEEALAKQREMLGEAAMIRATQPPKAPVPRRLYDRATGKSFDVTYDADGNPVITELQPGGQSTGLPPQSGGGGFNLESMVGGNKTPGGTTIQTPQPPPPIAQPANQGTTVQGAASTPPPELQVPVYFPDEQTATAAANSGQLKDGQRVVIGNRVMVWRADNAVPSGR